MAIVQDLRKICESLYFDARMGPWAPEPNAQPQKRIPFVVLCGPLELPDRQPRCVLFSSASLEYVPSCSTLEEKLGGCFEKSRISFSSFRPRHSEL